MYCILFNVIFRMKELKRYCNNTKNTALDKANLISVKSLLLTLVCSSGKLIMKVALIQDCNVKIIRNIFLFLTVKLLQY